MGRGEKQVHCLLQCNISMIHLVSSRVSSEEDVKYFFAFLIEITHSIIFFSQNFALKFVVDDTAYLSIFKDVPKQKYEQELTSKIFFYVFEITYPTNHFC